VCAPGGGAAGLREWGRGDAAPAAGTRMLRRPAIDVAEIFIESVSYDSFIYFRKLLRNNGLRTTVPFVPDTFFLTLRSSE